MMPHVFRTLPRRHAGRDVLLVTALLTILGLGCSGIDSPAEPAGTGSPDPPAAAAPTEAAGDAAASPAPPREPPAADMVTQPLAWQGPDPIEDLESVTPPDGKWLVDEHGRKYFITRLRKEPGMDFIAADRKTIVHKGFYEWAVESEDEEYFYIRKYEAVDDSDVVTLLQQKRKEEEERVNLLGAGYKTDIGSANRLTFAPFEEGLPQSGQWRQGFEIADIDGDGNLDIVHGPARKGTNTPTVFLGDGAGRWRLWNAQWPQAGYDYGDVAVADLNGDGRLDLGLGAHLRGLIVLIQTAPGVFESWGKGLPFSIPGAGGEGE